MNRRSFLKSTVAFAGAAALVKLRPSAFIKQLPAAKIPATLSNPSSIASVFKELYSDSELWKDLSCNGNPFFSIVKK